jgi:hypothetical protein
MALSIKDDETDALVRKLAQQRKLSYTGAIRLAVSNELARGDSALEADRERTRAVVRELQEKWRALPDRMTDEEVDAFMYDENGLPH